MNETERRTNETVELLQQLIQNACVNEGTPESGQEVRNADLIMGALEGCGADAQLYESLPGRTSLVARHQGTDSDAPALCLMAHTDVVPVSPEGWQEDPFGGELITNADGIAEVWGRGAVDMLNVTAAMTVAFRDVVKSGKRYPGDVVLLMVADEEFGGTYGAQHLISNHWDDVKCDYVLTEYGGTPTPDGSAVLLTAGEKTGAFRRIVVHGTPGHGSMPYATDNALYKAAEIVRRIGEYSPVPRLDEVFADRLSALGLPEATQKALMDPARVADELAALPVGMARNLHACCHITMSPNLMTAGDKVNTIANRAEIQVDVRMLPGDTQDGIDQTFRDIIGPDLLPSCEIEQILPEREDGAAFSSTDTPLWGALTDAIQMAYPNAAVVPSLVSGGTDARFFRKMGIPAYGAGLLSSDLQLSEFLNRFHGHNERIDTKSLELTTQLWLDVLDRLWV
ncbi:MAG: M20/M25/M40 family metallo-hydrolase [Acidimicrobiales bacterium]